MKKIYMCFRCGNKFKKKYNFTRHLSRVKKCDYKLLDVSYDKINLFYDNFPKKKEIFEFLIKILLSGQKGKKKRAGKKIVKKIERILLGEEINLDEDSDCGKCKEIESDSDEEIEYEKEDIVNEKIITKKLIEKIDNLDKTNFLNVMDIISTKCKKLKDKESDSSDSFESSDSSISGSFDELSEDTIQSLLNKKKGIYKCENCGKEYKHQSSYCRHINHRCKKSLELSKIPHFPNIKKPGYKVEYPDEITEDSNTETITKMVTETVSEGDGKTTINNIYTTHNTINNIQNIGTQNIIIKNYGKEEINYITDDELTNLIKGPFASIQRTNNMIHFNNDHPENMNIKMKSKEDQYIQIYKKDKWCFADKRKIIKEMIERAMNLLDDYYNEVGKSLLSSKRNENYKRFQMAYHNSKKFKERLEEEIEMMVINNGGSYT